MNPASAGQVAALRVAYVGQAVGHFKQGLAMGKMAWFVGGFLVLALVVGLLGTIPPS